MNAIETDKKLGHAVLGCSDKDVVLQNQEPRPPAVPHVLRRGCAIEHRSQQFYDQCHHHGAHMDAPKISSAMIERCNGDVAANRASSFGH